MLVWQDRRARRRDTGELSLPSSTKASSLLVRFLLAVRITITVSCLGHTFLNELDPSSLTPKTIYRIANEIATISSAESLPSSISSSIFVRSDDTKMPLLKAIITGFVLQYYVVVTDT